MQWGFGEKQRIIIIKIIKISTKTIAVPTGSEQLIIIKDANITTSSSQTLPKSPQPIIEMFKHCNESDCTQFMKYYVVPMMPRF